jgi:hypothetical protein
MDTGTTIYDSTFEITTDAFKIGQLEFTCSSNAPKCMGMACLIYDYHNRKKYSPYGEFRAEQGRITDQHQQEIACAATDLLQHESAPAPEMHKYSAEWLPEMAKMLALPRRQPLLGLLATSGCCQAVGAPSDSNCTLNDYHYVIIDQLHRESETVFAFQVYDPANRESLERLWFEIDSADVVRSARLDGFYLCGFTETLRGFSETPDTRVEVRMHTALHAGTWNVTFSNVECDVPAPVLWPCAMTPYTMNLIVRAREGVDTSDGKTVWEERISTVPGFPNLLAVGRIDEARFQMAALYTIEVPWLDENMVLRYAPAAFEERWEGIFESDMVLVGMCTTSGSCEQLAWHGSIRADYIGTRSAK